METASNNGEKEGFVYSRFKAQAGGFIFKSLRRAQKTTSPTIPFGDVTFLCRDGKVVTNSVYLGATCSLMRETFASMSPYEREKIVISVPDYGTEVFAQAITVLYGGEVMFDTADGPEQQLLMEALLELGFSDEALAVVPSGKEPNVCIKRFLEDQGTEVITNQEAATVQEPPPEDSQDVGEQSQDQDSMILQDDQIAEDLVDDDEVVSLNDVNSEEEAELMGITVEEARLNRRMREKADAAVDVSNVSEDEEISLDDLNSEDEARVMNVTVEVARMRRREAHRGAEEMDVDGEDVEEPPKVSLRKNASGNRKRANEIQPEQDTLKKAKPNGRRRSSRLSESQKANLSEKSARSSTTSSKNKEDAPITDENTAPVSTRTSSRIRQGLSKKASAETPSVIEPQSQASPPQTRKKTQEHAQLIVRPPQARNEVELSHMNARNKDNDNKDKNSDNKDKNNDNKDKDNDTNNNGSGFHMNIEVDPKEIIKIKPLEVTVGDQANSSDTNAGRQGPKPTRDKRTVAKPKEASRSNKKADERLEAEPDSTEEITGDQHAVTKNSISRSLDAAVGKKQLETTDGASEIPVVSTSSLRPEAGEAEDVALNGNQNIQKETTDSESNIHGTTLTDTVVNLSEPEGQVATSKHPVSKDRTDKQSTENNKEPIEKQSAANKEPIVEPSAVNPIESVPECDSDFTYPPGTETLDALARWRRTIEYCNICEQQYNMHQKATKCLTKHGRVRCWICLKVMLTSFYEKHCTEEHANLPGKAKNVVKCPQCEDCVIWSNIKTHAQAHLWKLPAKVERTEVDVVAPVEQPNATGTNIRIKSPSELFEEDEAEDEPEVSSLTSGQVVDSAPPTKSAPNLSNSAERVFQQPPESNSNRQRLPGSLANTEEAGRTMVRLQQHGSASSSRSEEVNQTSCAANATPGPLTQPSYWSPGAAPPPPYQSNTSRSQQGAVQTATLSSSGLSSNLHQGYFSGNQRAAQSPSSSFVLRSGNTTPGVQQPVSSQGQGQMMMPGFPPSHATLSADNRSHANQQPSYASGRQQMHNTPQPRNQFVLSSTAAPLRPAHMNARFVPQQANRNTSTYLGPNTPVSNHPRSMQSNAAMPPPSGPLNTTSQAVQQTNSFTPMGPPQSLMGTSVGSRPASRLTTPAPAPGTVLSVDGIRFTAVEDHSVYNTTTGNYGDSAGTQCSSLGEDTVRNFEVQESLLEMEQLLDGPASVNDLVSASGPSMANNAAPPPYSVEDEDDDDDDDVALNFNYDKITNCYTCKKCEQMYKLRSNAQDHCCLAD